MFVCLGTYAGLLNFFDFFISVQQARHHDIYRLPARLGMCRCSLNHHPTNTEQHVTLATRLHRIQAMASKYQPRHKLLGANKRTTQMGWPQL